MNERYMNFKSPKRKWFEEDVELFLLVVMLYTRLVKKQKSILELEHCLQEEDWNYIAGLFPFKSAEESKFKYLLIKKSNL